MLGDVAKKNALVTTQDMLSLLREKWKSEVHTNLDSNIDALRHVLINDLMMPDELVYTSDREALVKIWRIYVRIKENAIKTTGRGLSVILGMIGGSKLCGSTSYCSNKHKIKELFDLFESPEFTVLGADYLEGLIDDYSEHVSILTDVVGAIAGEVADNTLPVAFSFLAIKFGIDDLCKCCVTCDGTGVLDEKKCYQCDGTGVVAE